MDLDLDLDFGIGLRNWTLELDSDLDLDCDKNVVTVVLLHLLWFVSVTCLVCRWSYCEEIWREVVVLLARCPMITMLSSSDTETICESVLA